MNPNPNQPFIPYQPCATSWAPMWQNTTSAPQYLCPDLLSIRNIGAADSWRGHLVRIFFKLLKVVSGV